MDKCHRLWEYSEFVSEVETNIQRGMRREDAIQAAVNHCIEQNILADILKSEKSEVLHMIFLTEYDEKKHLRHTFAEGKEEGREEKLIEMIQKKYAKGKSPEVIAEELEEDLETVRELLKRL